MSVDTELGREIAQIINVILQEVIQMQKERQYNEEQVNRSKVESEKAKLVEKMNDDTRKSLKKIDNLLKQNDELVSQYGASIGDYIDEGLAEVLNNEMQVSKELEGVYNRPQENLWPDKDQHTDILTLSRPAINAYVEICRNADNKLALADQGARNTRPLELTLLDTLANKDYPEKAEDLEDISWHWIANEDITNTIKERGLLLNAARYSGSLRMNLTAVEKGMAEAVEDHTPVISKETVQGERTKEQSENGQSSSINAVEAKAPEMQDNMSASQDSAALISENPHISTQEIKGQQWSQDTAVASNTGKKAEESSLESVGNQQDLIPDKSVQGVPVEKKELHEEPEVKAIVDVLDANDPLTRRTFEALLTCVSTMEVQVKSLSDETIRLRQEIKEMQPSPEKEMVQQENRNMEEQVVVMQQDVIKVKKGILEGCRKALDHFKQHGKQALKDFLSFLHIDSALEKAQKHVSVNLRENDQTLKEIKAITKEYHQSGQHLKNTGRMIVGKEPIADIKGPGIISKAITAHFKAERSCLNKLDSSIRTALENIKALSSEQIKEDSSMDRIYNIIQEDDSEGKTQEANEILDEKTEENSQETADISPRSEAASSMFNGLENIEAIDTNILSKDNSLDDDIER
ncbi:DUF6674 family protein [Eubacterium sp. 1001713B170207_170306_E7]|uniref:DUF6674 family protein n=1 Tax=Eubacterium sp. 1001713B170207_170306_E7 TaxID=2787097 RepID=UPI001898B6B9|nr:DUF6674 family protein [Eubacterium sp. 1001713B170207_170306_E7]